MLTLELRSVAVTQSGSVTACQMFAAPCNALQLVHTSVLQKHILLLYICLPCKISPEMADMRCYPEGVHKWNYTVQLSYNVCKSSSPEAVTLCRITFFCFQTQDFHTPMAGSSFAGPFHHATALLASMLKQLYSSCRVETSEGSSASVANCCSTTRWRQTLCMS